jgi:hypothetical protein
MVTGRPNQSDSAWSSLAVVPSGRVIVTLPSSRYTAAEQQLRYPPAGQPEAGPGVEESEPAVAAQPLRLYLGRVNALALHGLDWEAPDLLDPHRSTVRGPLMAT